MTLSTSATNKKTVFTYLAVTAFCIIFDKLYALFGHGITAASMDFMFLYPLFGGVLPFLLLWRISPKYGGISINRFAFNSYNSGIAVLTAASAMNGVFEIAGTSSPYLIWFVIAGWIMLLLGVLYGLFSNKQLTKP